MGRRTVLGALLTITIIVLVGVTLHFLVPGWSPLALLGSSQGFRPDRLFEDASPAVVRVLAFDRFGRTSVQGSGFVVSRDGLVVTNYHVVRGASRLEIVLASEARFDVARIEAADPASDLALLRPVGKGLQALELADDDEIKVGLPVVAIGSPQGLTNTLSQGLISGLREADRDLTLIQTSAPISPGSSGGPLLLGNGRVAGVTTLYLLEGQNLNFAVPASRVRRLLGRPIVGTPQPAVAALSPWLQRALAHASKVVDRPSKVGTLVPTADGKDRFVYPQEGKAFVYRKIAAASAQTGARETYRDAVRFALMTADSQLPDEDVRELVSVEAKAADFVGATDTARRILDPATHAYALGLIAEAAAKKSNESVFNQCVAEMEELAETSKSPIEKQNRFLDLANIQAECFDVSGLTKTIGLLQDLAPPKGGDVSFGETTAELVGTAPENFRSQGQSLLARVIAEKSGVLAALALTETIRDPFYRSQALINIAKVVAKRKGRTASQEIVGRLPGPGWKAEGLRQVARVFLDNGDAANARLALAACNDLLPRFPASDRENFLFYVATLQAALGDPESATSTIQLLKEPFWRADGQIQVALAYAKQGAYFEADRILAEARLATSESAWEDAMEKLANVQADAGHMKAALESAAKVDDSLVRARILQSVGRAFVRLGQIEGLDAWVERLRTPEEKALACAGIAEALSMPDQEQ